MRKNNVQDSKTKLLIHPMFARFDQKNTSSQTFEIFDMFFGNTAVLQGNVGVINQDTDLSPSIWKYGGFHPLIELIQYCSKPGELKTILTVISKLLRDNPVNQSLALNKGMVKRLVGGLETNVDLINESIERQIQSMLLDLQNKGLVQQFMKYFFLNFHFLENCREGF